MKKDELIRNWLERAKSNLTLATPKEIDKYVYLEDLCFNAQQCVEKSLKAYCIHLDYNFPEATI